MTATAAAASRSAAGIRPRDSQYERAAHPGLRRRLREAASGPDAHRRVQRRQRAAQVTEFAGREAERAIRRRPRGGISLAPGELKRPRGLGGRPAGISGHQVKCRLRCRGGGPGHSGLRHGVAS